MKHDPFLGRASFAPPERDDRQLRFLSEPVSVLTGQPCLLPAGSGSIRSVCEWHRRLIASIRRVLVITLEAATLTKEGAWATEGSSGIFHSSMIELGLLGLLVFVLVVSITLLRRYAPASKDLSAP